jgi:hypothetical protein
MAITLTALCLLSKTAFVGVTTDNANYSQFSRLSK